MLYSAIQKASENFRESDVYFSRNSWMRNIQDSLARLCPLSHIKCNVVKITWWYEFSRSYQGTNLNIMSFTSLSKLTADWSCKNVGVSLLDDVEKLSRSGSNFLSETLSGRQTGRHLSGESFSWYYQEARVPLCLCGSNMVHYGIIREQCGAIWERHGAIWEQYGVIWNNSRAIWRNME